MSPIMFEPHGYLEPDHLLVKKRTGLPSPSTIAWIFVVWPPRLNPMAWFSTRNLAFSAPIVFYERKQSLNPSWVFPYLDHQYASQKYVRRVLTQPKVGKDHRLSAKHHNVLGDHAKLRHYAWPKEWRWRRSSHQSQMVVQFDMVKIAWQFVSIVRFQVYSV